MIHELSEDMITPDLNKYTLTFDDGLYSQYKWIDKLTKINTEKIFFISTGIIGSTLQSHDFPTSYEAHAKAGEGIFEDFMTSDQIIELSHMTDVTIGAHSHYHKRISNFSSMKDKIEHIQADIKLMTDWFMTHLGYMPTKFCYPYNEYDEIYTIMLKRAGFTEFYGAERIDIGEL